MLEEKFEMEALQLNDKSITYKDIHAKAIIFCDGVSAASNPYFQQLPFGPNKGEVLLVEIDGLPGSHIYKRGMNLVRYDHNIFWMGASFKWDHEHEQPTPEFREQTLASLQRWLKLPVKLVDHLASIRPATLERRPFVGFHPVYPQLGLFNGMGAKGCSLAPWFAKEFVAHLAAKGNISPEVSIDRFKRILSREKDKNHP